MSRKRLLTDPEKDELSLQAVQEILRVNKSRVKKRDRKFLCEFYLTYFPIFMSCRLSFLKRCLFQDHHLDYFIVYCLFIRRGSLRGIQLTGVDKISQLPIFEPYETEVKFFSGDTKWSVTNLSEWCPDVYSGVEEVQGSLLKYNKPLVFKTKKEKR